MQKDQHQFFQWFDPDPKVARGKYDDLRRKLIFWFETKGFARHDVEDLLSQTITEAVKMAEKKPELSASAPEKYIFGIAKNLWRQHAIKKNKERKIIIPVEGLEGESHDASEPTLGMEDEILSAIEMASYKKCLRKCLRRLERNDCRIVIRFAKEGHGFAKTLSQKLGKPENYIYVRKFRALESLRACVEKCLG